MRNMIKKENKIYVFSEEKSKGILKFPEYNIETIAYLGKNGITSKKKEGDGKTPTGTFELGIILGIFPKKDVAKLTKLEYNQINKNMYWIDDIKSKHYNKLVDVTKIEKDWKSAEHLIEYPEQYEFLVEIKTNPNNISGNGSAIFLHCTNNKPTEGCIAIDKSIMKEIIQKINKKTKIEIR